MPEWKCEACDYENEGGEECEACGEAKPVDERYVGYKVGLVTECKEIPKTQKLKEIVVDIGGESVKVVTNAPNVKEGLLTVIATVGATVEIDGEPTEVKKTTVGGKPSNGMVCNGPMLGWTGGDAKQAVTIPEGTPLGSAPPPTRPRGI
eukprot:TRINITY_DN50342_c0_g1_i1.p1 TRINITY_DN50342_c0_g1~~TRINITY_DN50342_c0_g1_i1.p1  ORF type:complete len:149 (+),score=36.99 TRINITY_DN50342_c0_g1_i1:78-524(+)